MTVGSKLRWLSWQTLVPNNTRKLIIYCGVSEHVTWGCVLSPCPPGPPLTEGASRRGPLLSAWCPAPTLHCTTYRHCAVIVEHVLSVCVYVCVHIVLYGITVFMVFVCLKHVFVSICVRVFITPARVTRKLSSHPSSYHSQWKCTWTTTQSWRCMAYNSTTSNCRTVRRTGNSSIFLMPSSSTRCPKHCGLFLKVVRALGTCCC